MQSPNMIRRTPQQALPARPNDGFPIVQQSQVTGAKRMGPHGPDVPGPDGHLPPETANPDGGTAAMYERLAAPRWLQEEFQQIRRAMMGQLFPRGRQP